MRNTQPPRGTDYKHAGNAHRAETDHIARPQRCTIGKQQARADPEPHRVGRAQRGERIDESAENPVRAGHGREQESRDARGEPCNGPCAMRSFARAEHTQRDERQKRDTDYAEDELEGKHCGILELDTTLTSSRRLAHARPVRPRARRGRGVGFLLGILPWPEACGTLPDDRSRAKARPTGSAAGDAAMSTKTPLQPRLRIRKASACRSSSTRPPTASSRRCRWMRRCATRTRSRTSGRSASRAG